MAYFNYGTPAGADPRTYYAPRDVGGRLATWQANPGRLLDYQTGAPLSERLPATVTAPREMVYGDSYGGVQGAEQAQLNAINALVMQQRQMQQAAREAALNRELRQKEIQQSADINRFNMAARAADADLSRLLRSDDLARKERERLDRIRAANQADATRRFALADKAALADENAIAEIEDIGATSAADLSRLIPRANELRSLVSQDEKDNAEAMSLVEKYGDNLRKNAIGLFSPIAASGGVVSDELNKAAATANAMLKRAPLASERAAELRSILKDLDSVYSNTRGYGFQIDPASGSVVHPETGLKFRINAPAEPSAPSGRTAQTNAVAAPAAPKVQSAPATLRYDPKTKKLY